MKKVIISILVIFSLLLSGCNKKESTKEQGTSTIKSEETSFSNSSASDTTATKPDSSSQDSNSVALWNSEKARELNQFVIEWGKTMKQTYREYTPDQNVDLYGLQLPQTVLSGEGEWQAVIDKIPIQLEWSEDGQ